MAGDRLGVSDAAELVGKALRFAFAARNCAGPLGHSGSDRKTTLAPWWPTTCAGSEGFLHIPGACRNDYGHVVARAGHLAQGLRRQRAPGRSLSAPLVWCSDLRLGIFWGRNSPKDPVCDCRAVMFLADARKIPDDRLCRRRRGPVSREFEIFVQDQLL